MKKFVVFAVIVAAIMCAGICFAAGSEHLSTKSVLVDRNNDGKIDGVDIYDDSGKVVKRGYDTNGDNFVDSWTTYDSQTGMPIVTKSDEAYELR